jgi:hypothetical protein
VDLTMSKDSMIVLPPRRAWFGRLALAGALLCSSAARAQQFEASLVIARDGGATTAGKLRVSGDKVRIETPDLPGSFFVIDGAKPAAYFVRPAMRVFMDARQSSPLTRLFVPVDPDNPCMQWQAMAKVAGIADQGDWRCERIGEQAVGTRSTIAYRAISARGLELKGWVDAAYKFPLRIETVDGAVISVENVRDESQPAQSFEIPAGFRKFSPEMIIEQVKQSDVWVEGVKDAPSEHP